MASTRTEADKQAVKILMGSAFKNLETTHKVVLPSGRKGKTAISPAQRVADWQLMIQNSEHNLAVEKQFANNPEGIRLVKTRMNYLAGVIVDNKLSERFVPDILPLDKEGKPAKSIESTATILVGIKAVG